MGVVLPEQVAIFLNFLGIPWVNVDEDHVREAARHVRTFVSDLENTLDSANHHMSALQEDYSGAGYRQLLADWTAVDRTHMSAFRIGSGAVAGAMDAAATAISVMKAAAIAEIAALAAAAGALLLSGGAALEPLVAAAMRRVVTALQHTIEEYIFGKLLESALERFEDVVQGFVEGLAGFAYRTTAALLDVGDSAAEPLHLNPAEVRRHADALTGLGDEVAEHYSRFTDNLARIGSGPAEPVAPAEDRTKPPTMPNRPTETTGPYQGHADNGRHVTPPVLDSPRPWEMAGSVPEKSGESNPANDVEPTSSGDRRPQQTVADSSRSAAPDAAEVALVDRTGASGTTNPSNTDRISEHSMATPMAHRPGLSLPVEIEPMDRRPADRTFESDSSASVSDTAKTSSSALGQSSTAPVISESLDAIVATDADNRDDAAEVGPIPPSAISRATRSASTSPWSRRNRRPEQNKDDSTNAGSNGEVPQADRRPATSEELRTPWTKPKQRSAPAAPAVAPPPAAVSAPPASRIGAPRDPEASRSDTANADAEPIPAPPVDVPVPKPAR
ncbi:hypothetical protein [Nocardia anaemiae]|uniref:hypothetical protein n=1 Tax=Nocardia anaemiae TaxID=263910 RepID=UPI0007A46080|nr:hypothetical protein [Nocardia anaemiae]